MPTVRPATPLGPVGLILPTFPQAISPAWSATSSSGTATGAGDAAIDPITELATLCRRAEDLGADALWATDHLFWHTPVLECMTALTVAATATTRAILGTCVVQLPLRQAPAVAKQAASLQLLTRGRVVLGVGVGSHPGEYQVSGIEYATRGRQLDRGIAELRRSWASGEGKTAGNLSAGAGETGAGETGAGETGAGETGADEAAADKTAADAAARYLQLPAPAPIPIWVGGSSEVALRRAAALADGWMPMFLTEQEYTAALDRLAKEIDRAGRPAGAVTPTIVLFVSIDDDRNEALRRGTAWMSSLYGIPAKAFARHLITGNAESVANTVTSYRDAGAEHVAVYITADEPLVQFDRLMAALR